MGPPSLAKTGEELPTLLYGVVCFLLSVPYWLWELLLDRLTHERKRTHPQALDEGPEYVVGPPVRKRSIFYDLSGGETVLVRARVLDRDTKAPVRGASVDVWMADPRTGGHRSSERSNLTSRAVLSLVYVVQDGCDVSYSGCPPRTQASTRPPPSMAAGASSPTSTAPWTS
jgi:hypothetical protein